MLSGQQYVGAPAHILLRGLSGQIMLTPGGESKRIPDFYIPSTHAATFPWVSHALWFYSQMVRWNQIEHSAEHVAAVRSSYRPDLYRSALAPLGIAMPATDIKVEGAASLDAADGFFDDRKFDPERLESYLLD